MSIRSDRINLLVSPEEKLAIEQQAAAHGFSVSEHIRQAALVYDVPDPELENVKILAQEVAGVVERLQEKLDAGLDRIEDLKAQLRELRATS